MTVTNRPRRAKRANGAGSVYWIETRQRWAAAISVAHEKRIVRSFKTEQEARAWLTEIMMSQPPDQTPRPYRSAAWLTSASTSNLDSTVYWDIKRQLWACSITRYFRSESEALVHQTTLSKEIGS
jgi:hypothetical protein